MFPAHSSPFARRKNSIARVFELFDSISQYFDFTRELREFFPRQLRYQFFELGPERTERRTVPMKLALALSLPWIGAIAKILFYWTYRRFHHLPAVAATPPAAFLSSGRNGL
jgi:hypothetical protein